MIITWLLTTLLSILSAIFSFLPLVTTIPFIGGYDIDTALTNGVGQAYDFANAVWVIKDVLIGASFIWAYYALKILARLILGSRSVGSH
jgi:hypothetical protein